MGLLLKYGKLILHTKLPTLPAPSRHINEGARKNVHQKCKKKTLLKRKKFKDGGMRIMGNFASKSTCLSDSARAVLKRRQNRVNSRVKKRGR